MKRTGFKRRAYAPAAAVDREQRLAARAARTISEARPRAAVVVNAAQAAPVVKAVPVRSEAYRRLVASLSCVICGVPGYSQAAHGSEGKGMGIKEFS